MLLKIQGYNFDMVYRSGEQMTLANTLSRLPNPENDRDIELDERVDGIRSRRHESCSTRSHQLTGSETGPTPRGNEAKSSVESTQGNRTSRMA